MHGSPDAPGNGFGRHGIILTGHDHEGCDTYHYINQSAPPEREWQAMKWKDAVASGVSEQAGVPGLREITVRSMMGDFAGNAGLLSLWFDEEIWDWKFEFVNCGLGTQHIWWIIHILYLVTLGVGLVYSILLVVEKLQRPVRHVGNEKAKTSNGATKVGNGSLGPGARCVTEDEWELDVPGTGKKSLRKMRE